MGIRVINAPVHKFSKIELRDILISTLVLSLALVIMNRDSSWYTTWFKRYFDGSWAVGLFLVMFAITILSFVGHEMGHKFTAQKYGMWSEYRMFPGGLLLCLAMSVFGFLFAAPGAVMIRAEYVTEEQNGRISIAGPIVNIILSAIGVIGCLLLNGNPAVVIFYLLMSINAALAFFNMLPIPPLDGSKIMRWDIRIWVACIAIAAAELAAMFMLSGQLYYHL